MENEEIVTPAAPVEAAKPLTVEQKILNIVKQMLALDKDKEALANRVLGIVDGSGIEHSRVSEITGGYLNIKNEEPKA